MPCEMHEWGFAQQAGKDWVSRTVAWESHGWSPDCPRRPLSLPAGCRGLGWLPLPASCSHTAFSKSDAFPVICFALGFLRAFLFHGPRPTSERFRRFGLTCDAHCGILCQHRALGCKGMCTGCLVLYSLCWDGYLDVPALLIPRKCHLHPHYLHCT